jgi:hypothetical protein
MLQDKQGCSNALAPAAASQYHGAYGKSMAPRRLDDVVSFNPDHGLVRSLEDLYTSGRAGQQAAGTDRNGS